MSKTPARRSPAEVVAEGYDLLGPRYAAWASSMVDDRRDAWLTRLTDGLPDRARVLDLGCGNGLPTARRLAERFDVTGVDISAAQVDAAHANVPNAQFLSGDMTTVALPSASFDAIVAFYSVIHVALAEWPRLLASIHDWLAPAARILLTLGVNEGEALEPDWLGVPMFFAGHDRQRNLDLLAGAGLEVVEEAVETTTEPEGPVAFHWVLAQRPA